MEENYNENKKSKKGIVVVILFILIILGLVGYILVDKGIIDIGNNQNNGQTESNVVVNKGSVENLDINNENIRSLFKNTQIVHELNKNLDNNPPKEIKKIEVSDMTDEDKLVFVINHGIEAIQSNAWFEQAGITTGFRVSEIKNKYEKIFGPNTFKIVNKFDLGGAEFIYNEQFNAYVTTGIGGGISHWMYREAIIRAKRYSDRIEITSAVVLDDGGTEAFYKNSDLKDKISDSKDVCKTDDSDLFNDEKQEKCYNNFIKNNKDKLMQYTYTYKLNKDGFYYYIGVKRTKE